MTAAASDGPGRPAGAAASDVAGQPMSSAAWDEGVAPLLEISELAVRFGPVQAVDGVSLTLVDVTRDRFSVALIPHTLAETTLGLKPVTITASRS